MSMERETTCCFTGHRPDKLPWGTNEEDGRCLALKESIARELEGLYRRGYRHFISGMARGADLYFVEAALALRREHPDVTVEGAVPCQSQADRWPEPERARWRAALRNRSARLRAEALVGHNTLRAAVAGYENETLSSVQLETMKQLLARELDAGAPGLSTGLLYVPGKFAPPGEIVELMRVVAAHDKIYATHLRSEGTELFESLDETIECALRAGLKKVHISHFKTAGCANWGKLDGALERLESARAAGIRITVDRYPWTESMTQLSVILPGKAGDLDDSSLARLLANAEERQRVAAELAASRPADYWAGVTLVSTRCAKFRGDGGGTIAALAEREQLSPAELVVDLLAADAAGTTAAFRGMSEENLRRILSLPFCMMGSDESARPADDSIGRSHPRGFGSAVRFLRRLLDAGSPIEAVVHRMTGLAAETFGLPELGRIEPGKTADFAAFDPEEVDATADFANPHSPAAGVLFTMVGGEFVYRA